MQLTDSRPKSAKPWFIASGEPYDGNDPCFFDTQAFPWVAPLEAALPDIRAELDQLLREHGDSLTPYFHPDLVSAAGVWKTFPLFFWGLKFGKKCRQCPKTTQALEAIPNMIGASFSMLEPHSKIHPHHGDTNAIARCHLGLLIPGVLPEAGLGVGDETRSWEEGKLVMFCDAQKHTAWNYTPHRRFVLILDIIRPEFASRKTQVCLRVWRAIADQWYQAKLKAFKQMLFKQN
jgi:ornithine lipid ester-linked acyl 2-hydroxylase